MIHQGEVYPIYSPGWLEEYILLDQLMRDKMICPLCIEDFIGAVIEASFRVHKTLCDLFTNYPFRPF